MTIKKECVVEYLKHDYREIGTITAMCIIAAIACFVFAAGIAVVTPYISIAAVWVATTLLSRSDINAIVIMCVFVALVLIGIANGNPRKDEGPTTIESIGFTAGSVVIIAGIKLLCDLVAEGTQRCYFITDIQSATITSNCPAGEIVQFPEQTTFLIVTLVILMAVAAVVPVANAIRRCRE
jgi:hypothetical protein